MPLPYPVSLTVPFGRDAIAPYIRVVPVASQIGIENGAASWVTGFVPLNMTLKTAGGVAPFGNDMNGVLNYITQNLAWLAAGGRFQFNADVVTYSDGYAEGAILQSAADPSIFFYNTVEDNVNDPDSDPTDWVAFNPLSNPYGRQLAVVAAGSVTDFALDSGAGVLDLNPTTGACDFGGVAGGFDGQLLTITNINASNPINILPFDGGSSAGNQFRLSDTFSLLQYQSMTFRKSAAAGFWVPL
jgi:hypothetical protein